MLQGFPRHRFTAADVHRMLEVGVLDARAPVELLDGELVEVSPQGPRHSRLTVLIRELLSSAFGAGFHVQDHSPIDAGPHSLPEPDVAVVRGDPRDLLDRHPTAAELALVVEVSVTSQAFDRAKVAIYARAGVVELWLVDVVARTVRVHTAPDPSAGEYGLVALRRAGEQLHPAGSAHPIPVDALLP